MNNKDYIIKDFHEIISLGINYSSNWFRGHSTIINDLTPKVFRGFNDGFEDILIDKFKKYGNGINSEIPKTELDLLFLMQHHGTPTRLLDWTENILIALFFAVSENSKQDGEIWIINTKYLDAELKKRKLNYFKMGELILDEAFRKTKSDNLFPIGIDPIYTNQRMSVQQSTFTIHPQNGETLTEILKKKEALDRIIIPKKLKRNFEIFLFNFGISHRTIFPDLDGLSKDISKNKRLKLINNINGISPSEFLIMKNKK